MQKKDFLSSIILFVISLCVLVYGIYIAFFASTGTDVWYYSPGFFVMFIGTCLCVFSMILFVKNYDKRYFQAGEIKGIGTIFSSNRKKECLRLFLSIALLAVYIFLAIGNISFVIATFLYLSVTMICFRKDGFPIWKILLISAIVTAGIYLFFGVIAAVPLP